MLYGDFKKKYDKLEHVFLGVTAYLVWYLFPKLNGNIKCAIIVLIVVELVQIESKLEKLKDLPKMLGKKDMWLDILAGCVGIITTAIIIAILTKIF